MQKVLKSPLTQKPHISTIKNLTDDPNLDWLNFWMYEFALGSSWQSAPGALSLWYKVYTALFLILHYVYVEVKGFGELAVCVG